MKKSILKSALVFLLWVSVGFSAACYEPVANTSGDFRENRTEYGDLTDTNPDNENESSETETPGAGDPGENSMNETRKKAEGFRGNLAENLKRVNLSVSDIFDETSEVEKRILSEYGAVFLTKAVPPSKVMFTSEAEVSEFQERAGTASAAIGGATVALQPKALEALQKAIAEAQKSGLDITPRDGEEAGKRSYTKTLELWNSRFEPALKYWKSKGRLNESRISRLKSLPIKEQVREVLELEKQGIYFNTFFNGTILSSVAAPGTSQHISMLAFDANEFGSKKVRNILAKHGWFRTVRNDDPHFTYLGYEESELPGLGLKKISKRGGDYWVPAN